MAQYCQWQRYDNGEFVVTFELLGLTGEETSAYTDLIERGPCPAVDLASRWRTTPANARTLLKRLTDKGLIEHTGRPNRVVAAPPDVALNGLVADAETELRQVRTTIAALTDRYRRAPSGHDPSELVETVAGLDHVMSRWERLQRSARRQVRGFDRPPYGNARNDLELQLLQSGIAYRSVYQQDSLDGRLDHVEELIAAGEQARITPELPMKLILIDDQYGLVPLHAVNGPESAIIIHASPLLEALSWLFETIWNKAIPVVGKNTSRRQSGDNAADTPSEQTQRLLRLLAAGATDAAIARQLGWSSRTLYRHLAAILAELGATSRFQAAVQALRRGWI
jgi:sugar-specific transcriptional regulator TrmB/DNA-binding CsgD family transcriptional regulator